MDVAGLVKVKVQADLSELDRGFAEGRAKSGAFDREASRAFRGVDAAAKDAGRSIHGVAAHTAAANDNFRVMGMSSRIAAAGIRQIVAAGAALGAVAIAGASFQPIFAFMDALAEVSTLVDMATFDMNRMETSALAMAAAFGGGATAQVKAFNDVISAGTEDLGRATQIVEAANKLAIGGATSVAIATDGLTSILNAYGDKVGSATEVSDAMFIAMRDGKTTVEELSSALGRVAPIAAQTNVSFDELTAAIAALTLGGISTAESVTGIRAMLAAVAKPTSQASKLANQLGIEFNVAGLQAKGFVGFLQDLMAKTGGSTDQLAVLFGGVEALVPAMALAGSAGDSFANSMENMATKAGATEEAFDKMANSPGFQAGRMWSALQAEIIGAGGALEYLVPVMKAVADNMHLIVVAASIFTAGHLVAAIIPVIAQVAAMTAGMGAAAIAARGLSLAMAFFGGPIGIAVGALAAAYFLLRDSVSAAEQATIDARSAYSVNEMALNDNKAASEGYTEALRNQIAMQVAAAEASFTLANANAIAASARRAGFEAMTGLKFAPFVYAEDVANVEATELGNALLKLEGQLAKVDGNLQKTATSAGAAGSALAGTEEGANKAADAYARIVASARQYISEQELEGQVLGMTEIEANKLRYALDLLNDAKRAGIELSPKQEQELRSLAVAMAEAEESTTNMRESLQLNRDTLHGSLTDLRSALDDGKITWQELGDIAMNVLDKIIDKIQDDLVDALSSMGGSGSSGGGFLSSLLSGLGALFGGGGAVDPWAGLRMANGGAFEGGNVVPFARGGIVNRPTLFPMANGAGLMGEAGPEGILPLRRNAQGQLGVMASAAMNNNQPPAYNDNRVYKIDARGAQQGVGPEIRKALEEYDRKQAPVTWNRINADRRAR